MGILEEKQYLSNNDGEFPKFNVRHQTTDRGSSENIKQNKCTQIYTYAYHIQMTEKSKIKKSWKKPEDKNILPMEEQEELHQTCFWNHARREWSILSVVGGAPANLEFYTLWNYSSKGELLCHTKI